MKPIGDGGPSGEGPEAQLRAARAFVTARDSIIGLSRAAKRVALILADFTLLSAAVWLTVWLRYGEVYARPDFKFIAVMFAAPAIGVAVFGWFGLYRMITRFIGPQGTARIVLCSGLSVLLWALVILMTGTFEIPRTAILMYGLLGTAFVIGVRQAGGALLRSAGVPLPRRHESRRSAIVIYGATATGMRLSYELAREDGAQVVGFIDDDRSLWGQYIDGVKVYRPDKLTKLIEREGVGEVILAVPAATRAERKALVARLEEFPVRVQILPELSDVATGRVTVNDLKQLEVEDLLGRDPVPPIAALIGRTVRDKSVMVTGAGGSIGRELVRQILRLKPNRLVLFEMSEAALYEIGEVVEEIVAELPAKADAPEVVSVLGSVLDDALTSRTIREHGVETIYHAAAYKHVPIVEENAIAGLINNALGTRAIARVASRQGVKRFVLISTDKAVRPTNVMGASKRLAELILQALAAEEGQETVFTMVRFGNVLDSSGSVVRRFRRQIAAGGPVTVTHPEVIRYFMSIPEAAGLVLQAGAMAKGGEVFVLDMGEPVKIADLARTMIWLMGREVKDEANPEGDIQIAYTGLRPGEKLYEELLIDAATSGTEHPRINRNNEPALSADVLERELKVLEAAIEVRDRAQIDAVLARTVEGYQPSGAGRLPVATAAAQRPGRAGLRVLH